MVENPPEPDDDPFGLVEQYDFLDDPDLRSDFLDAMGTTRSYINALRLRRDAARKAAKAAHESDEATPGPGGPRSDKESKRREPLLPRRSRVAVTRPPNKSGGTVRRRRRNRERPDVVVIILRLD
ncbi:hypothetical protein [Streptomyces atratus]|uniref:hypothetical protein n=1 Tax=Streptomyces atratus TaxID=1893 RepID=UPI0037994695